ncbi:DUF2723 domain-containing protein [Marinilabiliaceae bacterium ANBcel2]|nr:DUF2723 domain-containing protein [Marinilabiliaceae bacterium ANBcel2]
MYSYKRLNIIIGWFTFLIAATVYTLTIEPTASFWDCGEFIAASYKMLIGHPPGAPFFQLAGRFFTLFAGDPGNVAITINFMSALASAFTILFLFWTITHLGVKAFINEGDEDEVWKKWAVLGAGFTGAMAFTFSDTFWFSAVEGEVYAMSSMFTAIVFWAILKWENIADQPHSNRWLILIAYLMGLSIGVHLLNLLTIPAIAMIYYFKKYEVTRVNTIKALLVGFGLLAGVLYVIIPYVVVVATWFELLFVNNFGLPYKSGVIVYLILLVGALVYGIYYTYINNKPVMNTLITGITVLLLGYSSFATVVIRSDANPTMDQNSPDNLFSFMSYLNRDQYGDDPLLYGPYYSSPLDWDAMENDQGTPVYAQIDGRYEIIDYRPDYKFNSKTTTIFPRMHSREPRHIEEYKRWANIEGRQVRVPDGRGGQQTITVPTFFENIKFFLNYQIKHMYFRYFMWNFSGRQNDMQGHGEFHQGNWITGIPFIDKTLYGDESKLPEIYTDNPARNKYYLLPFILGLIGISFQLKSGVKGKRDFWTVMMLFLLTGLAICIYLNQTPLQPRERDYAYVGSFYAFSIWIGLGVLGIAKGLKKYLKGRPAAITATALTFVLVPLNMASDNWSDHDRSDRTIARDLAYNYLNTVGENGIIFTNGDNDTFPLWYAQEVEGIRTDVRVCNLSYLQTDWYIDQMKRKAYESDPLPFSLEKEQYLTGTRDVVYLIDRVQGHADLKEAMRFLASDSERTKRIPDYHERLDHLPSKTFTLKSDSAKLIENGFVNERYANLIEPEMIINLDDKERILKNEMMVLDLMAHNDWDRPVYYAVTVGSEVYAGMQDYFQLEGFGYQIVPIRAETEQGIYGRVDTEAMYDNMMNKYKFNGWNDPDVYLDENHRRMGLNIRNNLSRLATALLDEGEEERAREVLDKTIEVLPTSRIPHNYFSLFLAEGYYRLDDTEKGDEIIEGLAREIFMETDYFLSLSPSMQSATLHETRRNLAIYGELIRSLKMFNRDELASQIEDQFQVIIDRLGFLQG